MNKIMLLEDDLSLIDGLQYALHKNQYEVNTARTLEEAEKLLSVNTYDLLLMDVTLPDGTGFSLCEKVRARGNNTPIIFLTAADEEISIIRGLDSGADDYITKPFKLGELCSRIRAILRRSGGLKDEDTSSLKSGDITINLLASQVIKNNTVLELTTAEYRLLCFLIKNKGQVLERNLILDQLWDGSGSFVDDNTLSVYIRRLREKIEDDPSHPDHLITIRGMGYKWNEVIK